MKGLARYPGDAEFAFTILDDTDDTTVANGRPVYDLLSSLDIKTTKTVWAFDTPPENQGPYFAGETLANRNYFEWVRWLANQGFEIAFHNATMGSSVREDTEAALNFIEESLELQVRLHCNHGQNKENLYWGYDRYHSFLLKSIFKIWAKWHSYPEYEGANPESPYYWADIAEKRLFYMRSFTFRQLNGRKNPPTCPYRSRYMRAGPTLFSTTDAPDILAFNKLVNPERLDQLKKQNGWAIVSTHLGKGYCVGGQIDIQFQHTMEYMSSLGGWYVPVSELLDFLVSQVGARELSYLEQRRMEFMHVFDRVKGKIFDVPLY